MPGCREIFEKLKSLPPKKVAFSMAFNAALSTVVGCGAGVMGAGVLGLDLKVGAND